MNQSQPFHSDIALISSDEAFERNAVASIRTTLPDAPIRCFNSWDDYDAVSLEQSFRITVIDWKSMATPEAYDRTPALVAEEWLAVNVPDEELPYAVDWIERGYAGMLSEHCNTDMLSKAIESVHSGELWFTRAEMARAIKAIHASQPVVDLNKLAQDEAKG
ncbi:hypothetical protein [Ferrimonas marina]|uniref:Uncharacterized protein n=1 Tax=Ferrimonas marina TaxID=299255 RepID=A0A1M5VIV1_9GAMM|nr:hypothetical protein [Ferrimonas marina]SHH75147.1 hypothetical protein SAMN02745129_2802 [Ferrimonas marina]